MMQPKFLLFSAVCCCLLQAMLCQLPPSAMFRFKFSKQPLFSSDITSSSLNTSLPTAKQEESAAVSSKNATPVEYGPEKENATEDAAEKAVYSSPKKKLSKAASTKNSNSKNALDIEDLDELKERSKELLRDLLRNENANRAITFMAIGAKDLLENEVTSKIISTHTNLIKETLTNEEAKEIIKDIRLDIFKRFINPETAKKVEFAFEKSKQCLSRNNLPEILTKRFKILRKIINSKKTYPAMVSLKKALVNFLENSDANLKIAKGFKLLDFGIHFDPDNVLKSLTGISIFK